MSTGDGAPPNASSTPSLRITSIRAADAAPTLRLPLYLSRVPAGFPSPADDYVESKLDLNAHVIRHEAATFYLRVDGRSMEKAGIHDGDLIVVDRAIEPEDGAVVVAALDGELTVKRYRVQADGAVLEPDADGYDSIRVHEGQHMVVWGVVTHVIHEVS